MECWCGWEKEDLWKACKRNNYNDFNLFCKILKSPLWRCSYNKTTGPQPRYQIQLGLKYRPKGKEFQWKPTCRRGRPPCSFFYWILRILADWLIPLRREIEDLFCEGMGEHNLYVVIIEGLLMKWDSYILTGFQHACGLSNKLLKILSDFPP